jgi:large subunit ribosomal protein L4
MADVKLNTGIYSVAVENHELLKLAYDAYLANSRSARAKTLKRGEVRGGGKKPWRQKGTGRARFGSTRNPIWRHGGVAFGPTGEANFTKTIGKNAKRIAIRQALSLANKDKVISIVADFAPKDGRVKEAIKFLENAKADTAKNILLVVAEKGELVIRATRNIANLQVVRPTYLNVFDIMNADSILLCEKSLPVIEGWLLESPVVAGDKAAKQPAKKETK